MSFMLVVVVQPVSPPSLVDFPLVGRYPCPTDWKENEDVGTAGVPTYEDFGSAQTDVNREDAIDLRREDKERLLRSREARDTRNGAKTGRPRGMPRTNDHQLSCLVLTTLDATIQ